MSSRPPHHHPDIVSRACRALLDDILSWMDAETADPGDRARIVSDLVRSADHDAYRFARRLDDLGWAPDSDLVEILSGYNIFAAHRAAVAAWVRDEEITIPFRIGDAVLIDGERGRIADLRPETAELIVQPETGGPGNFGEKGGVIVAVERASAA